MSREKSLVSIITITFNLIKNGRENLFRQCLESVHNQTYENIEHIIVDGASKDGTVNLIKEYSDNGWVKYISELDTGIYNAMNKGVKLAKGKYIAFLNSDDFYHNPDAVKLSVNALERENADFSYANYIAMDNANTQIIKGNIETFLYTMPFGHPTMFAKASAIRAENGFNQIYKVSADYDLIVRLILKNYKGVYLDADIASYRLGGICCSADYSDEIAQIYIKNYSPFYKFLDANQAKKIMFGMIIPEDFPMEFKKFAVRQDIKNIDIDKVTSLLETKARESLSQRTDSSSLKGVAAKFDRLLRNSWFRQPVRRIYYAIRFKKIN